MHRILAEPDGFTIHFTEPAGTKALSDPATYQIATFHYEPSEFYGGTKVGQERFTPSQVIPAKDGKSVRLKLPGLKEGQVVHFRLVDLKSASGGPMWSTEAWYTLNRIPKVNK